MKNGNGYGTIVKLSGKRKKPFAIRVTDGWYQPVDAKGNAIGKPKQKRRYLNYYEDRKSALLDLAILNKHEDKRTIYKVEDKKVYKTPTFLEVWHMTENNHINFWSNSTYKNYSISVSFCEKIHNIPISDIGYKELQEVMNDYMNTGKTKGMCSLFKSTLSMIFNEAIRIGYIQSSPVTHIKYKETRESKKKNAYSKEFIKELYQTRSLINDILIVLIYSGMRINELLNLKKENVFLEEGYFIGGFKTEAGKERNIPIHSCIENIVKEYYNKNETYLFEFKGKKVSYNTIKCWLPKGITFHESRHTFISLADEYEMNAVCLKRIVGHSTRDITSSVYTHKNLDQLKREIEKIPSPENL